MIDNKTINCITLQLHKAYPVSSVAISNLKPQQSKWLLIPISQKCSLSDSCQIPKKYSPLKLLIRF